MAYSSKDPHIPVLADQVIAGFADCEIHTFFDGTLGAGGHASLILENHPEIERYIGCDRDTTALEIAKKNLEKWGDKVTFVKGNYVDLDRHLEALDIDRVDGFFLI